MTDTTKKSYTIQCTDAISGEIGCFIYDKAQKNKDGVFKATSPVFSDLALFFQYCNENNIELERKL